MGLLAGQSRGTPGGKVLLGAAVVAGAGAVVVAVGAAVVGVVAGVVLDGPVVAGVVDLVVVGVGAGLVVAGPDGAGPDTGAFGADEAGVDACLVRLVTPVDAAGAAGAAGSAATGATVSPGSGATDVLVTTTTTSSIACTSLTTTGPAALCGLADEAWKPYTSITPIALRVSDPTNTDPDAVNAVASATLRSMMVPLAPTVTRLAVPFGLAS
jgi:hypothetical protein